MDIRYRVHSCTPQPFSAEVQYGGQTVDAQITGLVVEMVSVEPEGMSHTLKVVPESPEELAELEAAYAVDSIIVGSFAPEAE